MKRLIVAAMSLVLGCALLAGCGDEKAAGRRAAQDQLGSALAQLRQAALTPPDAKSPGQELERKKNLDAAAAKLEELADPKRNPGFEQRGQVLNALAQIDQWRAQDFSRDARRAWDNLSFPQVQLLTDVDGIGTAAARVAGLTVPNKNDINELEKYLTRLRDEIKTSNSQLQTANTQIDALEQEKARHLKDRDAARKQWQDLTDQAAVKQGEEQLHLYQDAIAAQRRADSAGAAAEGVDAKLTGLNGEQALLTQKLALARQAEQDTKAQINAANARNDSFDKARGVALGQGDKPDPSSREALVKDLRAVFAKVDQDYKDQVDVVYDQAAQRAQAAVKHLQDAETATADLAAKRSVKAQRLGAIADRTSLMVQQIVVAGRYAQLLQNLAAQAQVLKVEGAQAFTDAADRVTRKQSDLIQTVVPEINDAVNKLAPTVSTNAPDDPAVRQSGQLRGYLQTIAHADVTGGKAIPPAPEMPAPGTPASSGATPSSGSMKAGGADSPKALLELMAGAFEGDDGGKFAAAIDQSNASGVVIAKVMGGVGPAAAAKARLEKALTAKFGAPAAKAFLHEVEDPSAVGGPDKSDPAVIRAAPIKENGDQATAALPHDPDPIRMVRKNGRWFVDVSQDKEIPPAAATDVIIKLMAATTKVFNATADAVPAATDVAAVKAKIDADMKKEVEPLMGQMMQLMMQGMGQPPATPAPN